MYTNSITIYIYVILGLSPDYLIDEFEMFRPTTNIELSKCESRDEYMFKLGLLKSTAWSPQLEKFKVGMR